MNKESTGQTPDIEGTTSGLQSCKIARKREGLPMNLKTAIGLCARRGSAFGSAGILPAKRMHQIVRMIFAGKMPALP